MINDTNRLNFVLAQDAFIVRKNADTGQPTMQLWTQDADEEYHTLHSKSAFFKTERDAIDAAMLAAAPQPPRSE